MQVEHMEVTVAGSNRRQVIGPFSGGLNVIADRYGNGRARLTNWLRQIIAESGGSPYGWHSTSQYVSNSDLSHLANDELVKSGLVEFRCKGTSVRFVQPDVGVHSLQGDTSAVTNRQRHALDLMCSMDDVTYDSRALDDFAVRLGLDNITDSGSHQQREHLIARERDLMISLDRQNVPADSRDDLLSRRRDIEYRLSQIQQQTGYSGKSASSDQNYRLDRFASIEADLQGASAEIESCDRQIAEVKASIKLCEIGSHRNDHEHSYREQLQRLEDRLDRWRQTLRDIKNHRESIEFDETGARLEQQTGMQLSGSLSPDARGSMRSLESQLHNARKHVEQLVQRYASSNQSAANSPIPGLAPISTDGIAQPYSTASGLPGASSPQVQRRADGGATIDLHSMASPSVAPSYLPDILRSMQNDLHDVCHHLSRYEAQAAAQALKQQVSQLRRCERELLQSVEKLVEERGQLLSKIADKYHLTTDQVSLAFGDWCQCGDHEDLADWLLKDEACGKALRNPEVLDRTRLTDKLSRLQAQRKHAVLRMEECRRQLREMERGLPSSYMAKVDPSVQMEESDLLRELETNSRSISELDMRDKLRAELDDVRHQMSRVPHAPLASSNFSELVNRHILGLSGSTHWAMRDYSTTDLANRQNGYLMNGSSGLSHHRHRMDVPACLVRAAKKLAICQSLAIRGEPIPVILDSLLDGLTSDSLRCAVDYLTQLSRQLQIIVLTDNRRVAELIESRHGTLLTVRSSLAESPYDEDINRVLTSFANEQEADKWYRPAVEPVERPKIRQYYLSRHSRIEDLPALQSAVANRLRDVGVKNVGDLLDSDAQQLSNELSIRAVTASSVRNWQSLADLLCNVRGLRPFDARVLVGAGVRSARQLSSIRPNQLLESVEQFLATDLGRRILRSGNSYELSRITSWIASANGGDVRTSREIGRDRTDGDGYFRNDLGEIVRIDHGNGFDHHPRRMRSSLRTDRRKGITSRRRDRSEHEERRRNRVRRRSVNGSNGRQESNRSVGVHRFYLELASPIVDAPSIGPKTGVRLNQIGVHTVEQFLSANAESLARKLNLRQVTAELISQWQDQSRLVCRIPNLRGHDAQMLVACRITSPEVLASMNPESVLNQVVTFARSAKGQRVLRGGNEPDLVEVRNWIAWASQSRTLNAA